MKPARVDRRRHAGATPPDEKEDTGCDDGIFVYPVG